MTVKEAQNILLALAYCSITDLNCLDCPLDRGGDCGGWTDEDVIEAVNTLKGADNEQREAD